VTGTTDGAVRSWAEDVAEGGEELQEDGPRGRREPVRRGQGGSGAVGDELGYSAG